MGKVLILTLMTISNSYATDLKKHPIYTQILKNKPKINKKYAMKLSNAIYKASKTYRIPKHVYTAILAQESGYKLNTTSKITGIYNGTPTTVIVDFGISQINWRNVWRYQFNVDKLLSDMVYSIEAGARILSEFKEMYAKKETTWWSRYHSSNKIRRSEYEKLVRRYL